MAAAHVTRSPQGAFLNVGCGASWSPEWTNLDLHRGPGVIAHDLREPLPFAAETFDAVYSSHVLEHLERDAGVRLLAEMRRVLRRGGIVRVVVPDLERIARDYVERLDALLADPADELARKRFRWIKVELLDQLVRSRSGGDMVAVIERGEVDTDDVRSRMGDELTGVIDRAAAPPSLAARIRTAGVRGTAAALVQRVRGSAASAEATGEKHRWMYDRAELRLLLQAAGFDDVEVTEHDRSRIPGWAGYALDTAMTGTGPRKPDSLYVEAVRA